MRRSGTLFNVSLWPFLIALGLATIGPVHSEFCREALRAAEPGGAKVLETPVRLSSPPFAVRELYAVGHFGNSYEVMGEYEMRRYLAEAKHWGFNRYADWFDMEDCSDPFAEKRLILLSHAMWERKKQNFPFRPGPRHELRPGDHAQSRLCRSVPAGTAGEKRPQDLRPIDLSVPAGGAGNNSEKLPRICLPIWPRPECG